MLLAAGLELAHSIALPDHHAYDVSPFTALPASPILITAKDAVKCMSFNDDRLWSVHVSPVFSDPGWLDLANDMLRMIAQHKSAAIKREHEDGLKDSTPSLFISIFWSRAWNPASLKFWSALCATALCAMT